ncbi:MAG: NADP oxidoreductase [Myxococcaceae bacterium]|jgi:NAD-reducing hydrogenase small subunit|nr:NADP oxidoreductase [Myxococcaceae bacterium]
MTGKVKLATTSLAGCFGCHMSFLDLDERILPLLERVTFDRSPLTDVKHASACDVGLIEGGVCNEDNLHVLKEFRDQCRLLVSVGACAINGGLPAQRNQFDVSELLHTVYMAEPGLGRRALPDDVELPRLFDKVRPVHEFVRVDYFLPGCPPPADAFWAFLTALLDGREPTLPRGALRYD